MHHRHLLLWLLTTSVLGTPFARAGDLRLTTQHDGQVLALSGIGEKNSLLAGPDGVRVAEKAHWTLEGDVRQATPLVRWAPVYAVRRANERAVELTPDKPWRAEVQVRHVPLEDFATTKDLVPLLADWPGGVPAGGVAVAAWLVGDEITEAIPLPLPATPPDQSFGFAAEFKLSAEQAARGQPVVFLWRDGDFVAPKPLYEAAAAQEAFVAIRRDDASALTAALSRGARADARSRDGYSLIHYAAEVGANACLPILLQKKAAALNETDAHGWTPLHHATAQNRLATVQALIAAKAQVNARGQGILPALFAAIERGHADIVKALLERKAATGGPDIREDPMLLALRHGHADIAQMLADAKVRYDAKSPAAGRHLLMAAVRGHLALARWLVGRGVDPNAGIEGTTALSLAAREGDAASARALLEAGASVHKASKEGFTPLMAASQYGNLEYARALLEAGADPKATTSTGNTALHLAARADAAELTTLLLDRGADLGARTQTDTTALDAALLAGSARTARLLASRGATISLGASGSESLLAAAIRLDVAEPIEAALKEGWPANSTLAGVWPAIRVAEIFRSERCIRVLTAAGAAAADATQPMPLASVRELDQPLKVARKAALVDPRHSSEVFPEQVIHVQLLIDAEGRPLFLKADDGIDPRLGQAATESLANWRFAQLRRQGEPVAIRVQVPVAFPASDKRTFELDRVSQIPVPIKQVPPAYPGHLKQRGITGRVELAFIVGTDGKPHDIEVIRATHPDFAQAALDAISQWVFKPGSIEGRPVNTRMRQPLSFTLNDY